LQEKMLCYISRYVVKKLRNINRYACAENVLQNNEKYNILTMYNVQILTMY